MKLSREENDVVVRLAERFGTNVTLQELLDDPSIPIDEVIIKMRITCHDGSERSGNHTDCTGNAIAILNEIFWIYVRKENESQIKLKDCFESHGHNIGKLADAILHGKNGTWNEVEFMSASRIVNHDELLEYLEGLYIYEDPFEAFGDDEYCPYAGILY